MRPEIEKDLIPPSDSRNPGASDLNASAGSVVVPRRLLENLLDNTRQLRAENHWWKDEPRMDYQSNYAQLCDEIKQGEAILSQNDKGLS